MGPVSLDLSIFHVNLNSFGVILPIVIVVVDCLPYPCTTKIMPVLWAMHDNFWTSLPSHTAAFLTESTGLYLITSRARGLTTSQISLPHCCTGNIYAQQKILKRKRPNGLAWNSSLFPAPSSIAHTLEIICSPEWPISVPWIYHLPFQQQGFAYALPLSSPWVCSLIFNSLFLKASRVTSAKTHFMKKKLWILNMVWKAPQAKPTYLNTSSQKAW